MSHCRRRDPADAPATQAFRRLSPDHARYLERVPEADQYFAMHDFSYWRMKVRRVRWIAGFAKVAWIESDEFTDLPDAKELAAGQTRKRPPRRRAQAKS